MMRRWTIRAYTPRVGQGTSVVGSSTETYRTPGRAQRAADRVNARTLFRGPDDPLYRVELVQSGRDTALRMRIKLWRAKRFRAKVARRLRKVGVQ